MAYNTTKMLTDASGKPIPQIYDPASDKYIPLTLDIYRDVDVENFPDLQNVSDEVAQARLSDIIARLESNTDKVISLSELQTELAKSLSVNVGNHPTDYPDSEALAELQAIKQENEEIKQKIDAVNNRLNETLDTQLTGSIVKVLETTNVSVSAGGTSEIGDYNWVDDGRFSKYIVAYSAKQNGDFDLRIDENSSSGVNYKYNNPLATNEFRKGITTQIEVRSEVVIYKIRNNDLAENSFDISVYGVR